MARVYVSRLPLSAELRAKFGEEAVALALAGGEDYELLLCGRREALEAAGIEDLTIIGEVHAGPPGVRIVDARGNDVRVDAAGVDHLRGGAGA